MRELIDWLFRKLFERKNLLGPILLQLLLYKKHLKYISFPEKKRKHFSRRRVYYINILYITSHCLLGHGEIVHFYYQDGDIITKIQLITLVVKHFDFNADIVHDFP